MKNDRDATITFEMPPLDSDELVKKHAALIVVQGAEIGRNYLVRGKSSRIGRATDNEVRLFDDQASRLHAEIVCDWEADSGAEYRISDAGSTNGTFVNAVPANHTLLREGDKIRIGSTTLKFVVLDGIDAKFHEEIRDRITYDPLTGLLTKESAYLALDCEVRSCLQYDRPLAVLMMDLDRFKSVNDTYGHPMGSHMLAEVGRLIRENVRDVDVSARYGGEEFVTYLAGANLEAALQVAERVREAIAAHPFDHDGKTARVTISIGVAILGRHGHARDTLVASADRALYAAKEAGRNRVVAAQ